ncbi:MAG: hypothetical protein ACXVXB_16825 [Nocardioidaceae bacterium]
MTDLERRGRARGPVEPGGGRALLLAGAGILLASAMLPWGVLGLALEVAAIVVGVRALRRARARGGIAPGAVAGVIGASVAVVFFTVALSAVAIFSKEYDAYRDCADRAITTSAKTECLADLRHSLRDRLAGVSR